MKDLIKITIALAVVAGSIFVGKYFADEKCSVQINEMNDRSAEERKQTIQLQETIRTLNMEIANANSQAATKTVIEPKKK